MRKRHIFIYKFERNHISLVLQHISYILEFKLITFITFLPKTV